MQTKRTKTLGGTEYLEWVLSFYQGNLAYQSGWQDIQGYVYEAPAPEAEQALLEQLSLLGIAIGSEWSKHNDVRQIDTRMLSLWGSAIQLAPDFDTQKQTVEVIATDIDLLLSGSLRKQDILRGTLRRYFRIRIVWGFLVISNKSFFSDLLV